MAASLILRNVSWALSTLLELVLLFFLVRRRFYRSHPAFCLYVIVAILQSAVVAASYLSFGTDSRQSYDVGWGSQAMVIAVRWGAIMEISRKTFADYSGIGAMVSRILLGLAACVLVYSIASAKTKWELVVLNADRSTELGIATFIVALFVFVRYYRVPMPDLERLLAIGFCLYSCFAVLNDSIYENWRRAAGNLWDYLDLLTFTATLLLWISAVRSYSEIPVATSPATLSPEDYGELSQKLNSRLYLLNHRLNRLFRSEDPRP